MKNAAMKLKDVCDEISKEEERLRRSRTQMSALLAKGMDPESEIDVVVPVPEQIGLYAYKNAQAKSPIIEKIIAKKILGKKIPAKKERGDLLIKETSKCFKKDEYIELKISTTNKGDNINARQIRPWQQIDWYILGYINEDDIGKSVFYKIPHKDMLEACRRFGSPTHGTKKLANQLNYVEDSITIPVYEPGNEKTRYFEKFKDEALKKQILS